MFQEVGVQYGVLQQQEVNISVRKPYFAPSPPKKIIYSSPHYANIYSPCTFLLLLVPLYFTLLISSFPFSFLFFFLSHFPPFFLLFFHIFFSQKLRAAILPLYRGGEVFSDKYTSMLATG
jgi:hypothetical protein